MYFMHILNDHLQTSNLLNHAVTRACKGNDESSNPLFIHSFIQLTFIDVGPHFYSRQGRLRLKEFGFSCLRTPKYADNIKKKTFYYEHTCHADCEQRGIFERGREVKWVKMAGYRIQYPSSVIAKTGRKSVPSKVC